jgi:hypothetical protein
MVAVPVESVSDVLGISAAILPIIPASGGGRMMLAPSG